MTVDTYKGLLLLSLVAISLAACAGSPTDTPPPPPEDSNPSLENGTVESQPEDAVFIDNADLLIAESYPVQVSLQISGNLPTPCHEFHYRFVISPAAEEKTINVFAYSTSDPSVLCTQVLHPFEITVPIPMEGAPDGSYEVFLNGDRIGAFAYPGG